MYNYYPQGYQQPSRTEIIRVNGEVGANAFLMYPNSQALLLDTTEPIVWLAETDASGTKKLTPFAIEAIQKAEPVTQEDLLTRIENIEKRLNYESNIIADEKRTDNSETASTKGNTGHAKRKQSANADD